MTQIDRKAAAVIALDAAAYLRQEADFNRSWIRRGVQWAETPEYIARRTELAEQRELWARAIELLATPEDGQCRDCNGAGMVRWVDETGEHVAPCDKCGGSGNVNGPDIDF